MIAGSLLQIEQVRRRKEKKPSSGFCVVAADCAGQDLVNWSLLQRISHRAR